MTIPLGKLDIAPQEVMDVGNEITRIGTGIAEIGKTANSGADRPTQQMYGIVFGSVFEPEVNYLLDKISFAIEWAGHFAEHCGSGVKKAADSFQHAETQIADSLDIFK